MFCPNCGTQNSETASTCIKCGFNLKGASAPKFKGTMLMSQQPAMPPMGGQPGAPPAPPPPGMGPGMVPPPNPGLAGTMVGVAPAGMGPSAGPPPAPPPPGMGGPAFGGGADPNAMQGGMGGQPPLGGTMAIDMGPGGGFGGPPQGGFGGPPQGGFGGPPQGGFGGPPQGGFGGPPQGGPGGFGPPGAPPGGFGGPPPGGPGGFGPPGAPPGGYGGPPPGGFDPSQQPGAYGGPPPGGYGGPPMGGPPGYGQPPPGGGFGGAPGAPPGYSPGGPPQGGMGLQSPGAMMASLGTTPAPGSRPTRRNPIMLLLVQFGLMMGGSIVGSILASIWYPLVYIGQLASLAGFLWFCFNMFKMAQELKAFTNDQELNPVFMWIPCFNIYVAAFQIPALMARAKQQAGSQTPVRGMVLYLLLGLWAFASDLNDIAG